MQEKIEHLELEVTEQYASISGKTGSLDKRIMLSDQQYTHSTELKLQELSAKVDKLVSKQTGGNIYTRWGRTTK